MTTTAVRIWAVFLSFENPGRSYPEKLSSAGPCWAGTGSRAGARSGGFSHPVSVLALPSAAAHPLPCAGSPGMLAVARLNFEVAALVTKSER